MKKIQSFYEIACHSLKIFIHSFRKIAIITPLLIMQLNAIGTSLQQQLKISGTVTEATNGQVMAGVNVMIKGTTTGAITDGNGKYVITVTDPDATIVFSFIGYVSQEVPVAGKSVINIALQSKVTGFDEVVVIGYGTSTRKEITGSVSSIKSDNLIKGATRSPLGDLQGAVAGLSIMRTNGSDPNNEYTLRLRGLNSFSGGKSPLIVVDGVVWPYTLDMLNPEIIESFDILKDGSAAAIYGTRATNGVILVTTKQPEAGKAKFEFTSGITMEVLNKDERWFTAEGYADLVKNKAPDRAYFLIRGDSTDWQDVVFRTPVDQNYSFKVTAGTDKVNYVANIFVKDDQGLVARNFSRVVSPSIVVSQKAFNDRLSLSYSLTYSNVNRSYINSDAYSGVVSATIPRNPTEPIYDPSNIAGGGYYNKYTSSGTNLTYANPIAVIKERTSEVSNNFVKGSVNGSFMIVKGLLAKFTGSYNWYQTNSGTYSSKYYPNLGRTGDAAYSIFNNKNFTLEPSLEYKIKKADHNLQLMAGYSYYSNVNFNFGGGNYNFDTDYFLWNNIGSGSALSKGTSTLSSSMESNRLISFYGRSIYNFKTKYLLSASLRYEGSSRFGENEKWGLFPALSIGWRLNEEAFLKEISWINDLKLRAGVGVTGNQEIPNYQSLIRMSVGPKFWNNGNWINTFQSASNPNPDLKWEKKTEYNVGLDFGIFSRFTGTIDLYSRTTSDLLWYYTVPVPPNVLTSIYANVGSIRNRGIEISLKTDIIKKSSVIWNSTVIFALNRNKAISLSDPSRGYELPYIKLTPAATTWTQIITEGEKVGNFWAPVYIGAKADGTAQYKDVDKDGIISTEKDREIVGHDYPDFEMSWSNAIRYKKFDLSFSLRGMFGQSLINYDRVSFENWGPFNAGANVLKSILDRPDYTSVMYVWDSRYIEKSSFVKLDNLVLGYNLNIGATSLRLYVSGTNLITWTTYTGNDPEIPIPNFNTGIGTMGWNNLTYPYSRLYTFGIKLNF